MLTNRFPIAAVQTLIGAAALIFLSCSEAFGDTASVVAAANTLISTSVAAGTSTAVQTTLSLDTANNWSNLPGDSPRNGPTIGGGPVALSIDLSASIPSGQTISPRAAALALCQAALSDVGYTEQDEIRRSDNIILATGSNMPWSYGRYHIAILGTPSTTQPWMLQVTGHHLAYNITYNSVFVSGTPVFLGTEPPDWYRLSDGRAVVVGKVSGVTRYLVSAANPDTTITTNSNTTTDPGIASGTKHSPLETQRAAVSNLAVAIQADASVSATAKLTGTFSDVRLGAVMGNPGGDTNFPFIGTNPTYPTGTTGRGVLYSALNATEKAYVKTAIAAWVNTQASEISASLLADYTSDAALNGTYIGYGINASSNAALFTADVNNAYSNPSSSTANSYLRIDGPRVWIEFVVQSAVAYSSQSWVHYHSVWRDKLADYGNEFGGYLNVTRNATTYTRPAITVQPGSSVISAGESTTFTVTATGTATLNYQWYKDGVAIAGATGSSYTVTIASAANAGSYSVVVTNLYGAVVSSMATLTVNQPYQTYLTNYGLTGTTPGTDSDGDGISNGVEFVLGGNPTSSNTAILPTIARNSGALIFSFYEVANLGTVTRSVETSSDLVTWTGLVNGVNGVIISSTSTGTGYNFIQATIPTSDPSLFARLSVTVPTSRALRGQ